MTMEKQMKKESNSQFLINSVRELDKINNLEVKFQGTIQEIINNPERWAEKQAERILFENENKYLQAKKLGKEFWDGIKDKNKL